jgi:hypothetical protein
MLSERRAAQFGLGSACVLLVTTLTILYQGSREGAAIRNKSGRSAVVRDIQKPANGPGPAVVSLGK